MNIKRIALIATGVFAILALAGFSWIWFAPCWLGGCAPVGELSEYQAEGSELLDVNGEPFARLATVNRRIISLDSLPPYVPQAFISIEDQRFYRHGGMDFTRTAGAMVRNIRSASVAEGGSTITQQLARNLFPDWLPYQQRNFTRKFREARVARQIEWNFSKDKILELYLNHIYLGSGAYGIEAASLTYFGKPASQLTLPEAATIAGLPQAPSRINPKENMERSTRRRNLVLDQMVDAGYISAAEAEQAKAESITLAEADPQTAGPESSYFVERVRQELEETVGARFYTAGLRIHTTLDPTAQSAAEEELRRQLDAVESGRFGTYRHPRYAASRDEGRAAGSEYLQGAVVVMDAATGEVRALVGGRDFRDSNFDRASQAMRQAGSAFKPFIYASALERYGSPIHIVDDSPLRVTLSGGQVWEPRNYNNQYDGPITLRDALARSKNTATVRLAQDVGMGASIRTARNAGVSSDMPDMPSTALGSAEVRPIELVASYAAFANGGQKVQPHLIKRVVDRNGSVVWEARPRTERAIDPAVAFVLTTMLQDVVDRGTGAAVRAVGFRGAAAGKTGTTNDASDVWFVGYTPELVAGVWIGLDRPATIVAGASGGTIAAPVWGRIMQRIYASRPAPEGWRAPSGVRTAEVDRTTGAVVSEFCPAQGATYTEYFIRSAPTGRCPTEYRPRYADGGWIDEEWGDTDWDMPAAEETGYSSTVDWPELEALRRRVDQARDEVSRRGEEAIGGFGQDRAIGADGAPVPDVIGRPVPGSRPATPPPPRPDPTERTQPPAATGQPRQPAPPAQPSQPAPPAREPETPAPAAPRDAPADPPAQDTEPEEPREPPRLLGDPNPSQN